MPHAVFAGNGASPRSGHTAACKEQVKLLNSRVHAELSDRTLDFTKGKELAQIGAKDEEGRTVAVTSPAAVVADRRGGRLQPRDDLATCSTSLLP